MLDAPVSITTASGTRRVSLGSYIDAAAEERAHASEYERIKGLRNLRVDGDRFRDRFSVRGDSLWWFSEIYLHKTRVILDVHRALAGLAALIERERPRSVSLEEAPVVFRHVASQVLARRNVSGALPVDAPTWDSRLRALDLRARRLNLLARLAPDRFRPAPRTAKAAVAAFVHRAFWTPGAGDGGAETYIGPVLRELEARIGAEAVQYVGVGPSTHFRAHRPWRRSPAANSVIAVERFARRSALGQSRQVWQARRAHLATMERSSALRDWAVIEGVDAWPIVRELLAGIAWLQWPWSVRSMDEAAAALDALSPRAVLTYAEAGGWGRALILEARRRGIPTAGLQHGFIYRHWLNYLHEPDEMGDETIGFPRPTLTLLFDDYAAKHLQVRGHFPAAALAVTGSARLDALAASVQQLTPESIGEARRRLEVHGDVLLVATKEREARAHLPGLIEAAARLENLTVLIKPHPAESAEVYGSLLQGRARVKVVAPGEPLAELLGMARAVATVNSTVALDAGVLGIPALSIGLPNNLSPFVDVGALAGVLAGDDPSEPLRRILYDERFRQQLAEGRALALGRSATASEGRAAVRTAEAIRALAFGDGGPRGRSGRD